MRDDELTFRRSVTANDTSRVGAIVRASGFFSEEEIGIATQLVEDRLRQGAASGYEFLFAERGGEVVGYVCWGRTEQTARGWDLYWIAVDPAAQRGGLGRRLMSRVEAEIAQEGGGDIWVETAGRPLYEPTRTFYERTGYGVEARLRDYYAPGDDKIIYVKRLP